MTLVRRCVLPSSSVRPDDDTTSLRIAFSPTVSVQAMLFTGATHNWWQQTATLVRYQHRVQE